jgi:hypothetical protein
MNGGHEFLFEVGLLEFVILDDFQPLLKIIRDDGQGSFEEFEFEELLFG